MQAAPAATGSGRRRAPWVRLALLGVLLVVTLVVSIGIGSVRIPPGEVVQVLLARVGGEGAAPSDPAARIVWDIRLPRIVLGALVGMGLAVSGAAYQALFRNALAEPYIIGVSSGASIGAVLAIVFSPGWGFLGLGAIPLAAFAASLLTITVVYLLSRTPGGMAPVGLVLAGIALSVFFQAVINFFLLVMPEEVQKTILYWLAGGLSGRTWQHTWVAAPYILAGVAVVLAHARELNLLLLGDETALHLGVNVERVKVLVLGGASLAAAAAVAVTGVIGFVGLMVPHVVRLVVGPDHRVVLPASLLVGPTFLVLCDTVGRGFFSPLEVRVSIITGLLGGPFFLWLLRQKLRGRS